jgi:hypothetical protein
MYIELVDDRIDRLQPCHKIYRTSLRMILPTIDLDFLFALSPNAVSTASTPTRMSVLLLVSSNMY